MAKRMDRFQDERGPSARHLVLMFLAAIAVCAVFFSLGYVVGYNHSPSRITPVTEDVATPGNIPPTVNPPAGGSSQPVNNGVEAENVNPATNSIPKPVRPQPLQPEAAATPQAKPPARTQHTVERPKPRKKPAAAEHRPPAHASRAASSPHYVVQVMASRTRADAVTLVRLLKNHGYHVFIVSPQESQPKDHFYRVQVGPFASRAGASHVLHRLEGEGFRPFITH